MSDLEYVKRRIYSDLDFFCSAQLKIRDKRGRLIPFKFNKAQRHLHTLLEKQKRETGRVRAIILKGRQQGISTYVAGRFYHKTTTRTGQLTFIFAHDAEASSSLYGMVKTFYEHCEREELRPQRGASNAKELIFPVLRSGYKVGTAGTPGLGRSKTYQNVHWSEVAYSRNSSEHSAGILQTVPEEDDTEVILESTANGQGDYFHAATMLALAGKGDFILIFLPWYWQEEYTRPVPEDFELEQPKPNEEFPSEQEYYDTFKDDGLTLEHLVWRRAKIINDFKGDTGKFMQEYPFTPQEAFEASTLDSYIKALTIRRAINTPPIGTRAPLIIGADPARLGGDSFKLKYRRGRNLIKSLTLPPGTITDSAQRLAKIIRLEKPARMNIDAGGLGVGVYDVLVDMGHGKIVNKVDFGGQSLWPDRYYNKRAEMYGEARDWFDDPPTSIQLTEEEAAKLQAELAVIKAMWTRNSVLKIIPKEEIKKELGFSPDNADAFVLTFAEYVAHEDSYQASPAQATDGIQADISTWNPF